MASNETVAEAIVAVRKMIHDCPAIKGGLGELRYQLKANGAINIIEEAHDREIKALEWKIENYATVVECKDREVKAKDEKIENLKKKIDEYERQPELMAETAREALRTLQEQDAVIAELREYLKEAIDEKCKSCKAEWYGKCVTKDGGDCELIAKWRTALEGAK